MFTYGCVVSSITLVKRVTKGDQADEDLEEPMFRKKVPSPSQAVEKAGVATDRAPQVRGVTNASSSANRSSNDRQAVRRGSSSGLTKPVSNITHGARQAMSITSIRTKAAATQPVKSVLTNPAEPSRGIAHRSIQLAKDRPTPSPTVTLVTLVTKENREMKLKDTILLDLGDEPFGLDDVVFDLSFEDAA